MNDKINTPSKKQGYIISKKKSIPKCPECDVVLGDCECSFRCPSCKEVGDYTSSGAIICPSDVCRVGSFYTQ